MYQLFDSLNFFFNIFPHLDLQSTLLVLNANGELTNSTKSKPCSVCSFKYGHKTSQHV